MSTITAEIGTTGKLYTLTVTAPNLDIAEAVEAEHDCDDSSCCIDAAMAAGCPYVAACFLNGATEAPLLDAVLAHHGIRFGHPSEVPGWSDWMNYHEQHGRKCPHCDTWSYEVGSAEWRCGMCGKDVNSGKDLS